MDELDKCIGQIYGWRLSKNGKMLPPHMTFPLPNFVNERINWVSEQLENGLTMMGGIKQLINIDDEKVLKKEWEFGASTSYLPISKSYRDWLKSRYSDYRKVAIIIAFIYWQGDENEKHS